MSSSSGTSAKIVELGRELDLNIRVLEEIFDNLIAIRGELEDLELRHEDELAEAKRAAAATATQQQFNDHTSAGSEGGASDQRRTPRRSARARQRYARKQNNQFREQMANAADDMLNNGIVEHEDEVEVAQPPQARPPLHRKTVSPEVSPGTKARGELEDLEHRHEDELAEAKTAAAAVATQQQFNDHASASSEGRASDQPQQRGRSGRYRQSRAKKIGLLREQMAAAPNEVLNNGIVEHADEVEETQTPQAKPTLDRMTVSPEVSRRNKARSSEDRDSLADMIFQHGTLAQAQLMLRNRGPS